MRQQLGCQKWNVGCYPTGKYCKELLPVYVVDREVHLCDLTWKRKNTGGRVLWADDSPGYPMRLKTNRIRLLSVAQHGFRNVLPCLQYVAALLDEREQCVRVIRILSFRQAVLSGVRYGCVLELLLFAV